MKKIYFLTVIVGFLVFYKAHSQATPNFESVKINNQSVNISSSSTFDVIVDDLSTPISIEFIVSTNNNINSNFNLNQGAWVSVNFDVFTNTNDQFKFHGSSYDTELEYDEYFGPLPPTSNHPINSLDSYVGEFALKYSELWETNEEKDMTIEFYPDSFGQFVIYYRAAFEENGGILRDPVYVPNNVDNPDAFGYEAYELILNVIDSSTIPPTIEDIDPNSNESNVMVNQPIEVEFSIDMNESSVENSSNWYVNDGTKVINGNIAYNSSTRKAVFTPSSDYEYDADVWVFLYSTMLGGNGQPLEGNNPNPDDDYRFRFFTENAPPSPSIVSHDPSSNENNVPVNESIEVVFDMDMNQGTVENMNNWYVNDGTKVINGSVVYNSNTRKVVFTPSTDYEYSADVWVTLRNMLGVNGQPLNGNNGTEHSFKFVTMDLPELPQVVDHFPDDGSTGVPVTALIEVYFDKNMNQATVENDNNWMLFDGTSYIVADDIEYFPDTKNALFYPSINLDYNKTYTVTLTPGIESAEGGLLDGNENGAIDGGQADYYSFSFTTISQANSNGKMLQVPYYNQNPAEWCWATSLAMLLEYYGFDNNKPWKIAGSLGKDVNVGANHFDLDDIEQLLEDEFSAGNEDAWFGSLISLPVFVGGLITDLIFIHKIKQSINNGNPVYISLIPIQDSSGHVVVVTGYDNEGIYLHDPSGAFTNNDSNPNEIEKLYHFYSWIDFFQLIETEGSGLKSMIYAKPNKLTPNYNDYSMQFIHVYSIYAESIFQNNQHVIAAVWDGDENHELGYYYENDGENFPTNSYGISSKFHKADRIKISPYISKYGVNTNSLFLQAILKNIDTNTIYEPIESPVFQIEDIGSPTASNGENFLYSNKLPEIFLSEYPSGKYDMDIRLINENGSLEDSFSIYFEIANSPFAKIETVFNTAETINIEEGQIGEWEFNLNNKGTNYDTFKLGAIQNTKYHIGNQEVTEKYIAPNAGYNVVTQFDTSGLSVDDEGNIAIEIESTNDTTTKKIITLNYKIVEQNCQNPTSYYPDNDIDGFGDIDASPIEACEAPEGFVDNNQDCNDSNPYVYPNAPEVCDFVDNDCDGETDEGLGSIYYYDSDGDGYGDANNPFLTCNPPSSFVDNNLDCDDNDPNKLYYGAIDYCDGFDNDCDGLVDEDGGAIYYRDLDQDGYGNPNYYVFSCYGAPAGFVYNDSDQCPNTPIGAQVDEYGCSVEPNIITNMVYPGSPINITHCYKDFDNFAWHFETNDGNQIQLAFDRGYVEIGYDKFIIYDGSDTSYPILFNSDDYINSGPDILNIGALGLQLESTGKSIFILLDADESISCQDDFSYSVLGGYFNFTVNAMGTLNLLEVIGNKVKIHPNPVTDILNIEINLNANYSIFDLNGRLIKDGGLSTGVNGIKTKNFRSGLYFLNISTEKRSITKKIIIE